MEMNFDKIKNQYDIIYLLDSEIGIDSGHSNERPCLVLSVNEDGSGYVIPITSRNRMEYSGSNQHQLAFGSWIDLDNRPIFVDEPKMTYARLSDYYVDQDDIEVIEYRYADWV